MIPKRMFFYWDKPYFSWMRYMTLYSFRKMNPDWEIILCMPTNRINWNLQGNHKRDFLSYKGHNYFDNVSELNIIIEPAEFPDDLKNKFVMPTPVHYSDLYRYYKLYSCGGFYSDMDVLYFRSMDNIYNKIVTKGANTVLYTEVHYTAIGFLGASQHNMFFWDLMMSATNTKNCMKDWESYGALLIYNLFNIHNDKLPLIERAKEKHKGLKIYNIPKSLIYHYAPSEILKVFSTAFGIGSFSEESIGYHWYGGHPTAQEYNNILDEHNHMNYEITFSKIIKELQESVW